MPSGQWSRNRFPSNGRTHSAVAAVASSTCSLKRAWAPLNGSDAAEDACRLGGVLRGGGSAIFVQHGRTRATARGGQCQRRSGRFASRAARTGRARVRPQPARRACACGSGIREWRQLRSRGGFNAWQPRGFTQSRARLAMWLLVVRGPLPEAASWPGRHVLAALDAPGWPILWVLLIRHAPQPLGLLGPVLTAFALVWGAGPTGRRAVSQSSVPVHDLALGPHGSDAPVGWRCREGPADGVDRAGHCGCAMERCQSTGLRRQSGPQLRSGGFGGLAGVIRPQSRTPIREIWGRK